MAQYTTADIHSTAIRHQWWLPLGFNRLCWLRIYCTTKYIGQWSFLSHIPTMKAVWESIFTPHIWSFTDTKNRSCIWTYDYKRPVLSKNTTAVHIRSRSQTNPIWIPTDLIVGLETANEQRLEFSMLTIQSFRRNAKPGMSMDNSHVKPDITMLSEGQSSD